MKHVYHLDPIEVETNYGKNKNEVKAITTFADKMNTCHFV